MTESVASGTIEADYYYERVAAALADLPKEARDELLEDLPAHFAEVLAEQGGPLVDRLGPPATYAAELRAAAGLDTGPARAADRAPLAVYYERLVAALPELDRACRPDHRLPAGHRVPAAVAPRLVDRPRGRDRRADLRHRHRAGGPLRRPARLAFLVVAIIVSIRIGATGVPRLPRWIGFAGTAVAVVGVLFVIANAPSLLRQYTSQDYYATSGGPFAGVTNVFPVDERGQHAGAHHAVRPERQPDPGRRLLALHERGRRHAGLPAVPRHRPAHPGADGRADRHPDRLPGRDPDRDGTRDHVTRAPRARRRPGPPRPRRRAPSPSPSR